MNTALASIRHLIKQTEMNEEEIVQQRDAKYLIKIYMN